jgi:hypothetical protein
VVFAVLDSMSRGGMSLIRGSAFTRPSTPLASRQRSGPVACIGLCAFREFVRILAAAVRETGPRPERPRTISTGAAARHP